MAELRRSQIQNVTKFIRKHFQGAEERHRKTGVEYKFVCPFCEGGWEHEVTFHLNPEKGAGHCFRSNNCGWKGGITFFISQFLKISYEDAEEIVGGENPHQEMKGDLQHYIDGIDDCYESTGGDFGIETVGAWVNGATPLDESPLKERVHRWLKESRKYDPEDFCKNHNLYIPPQIGKMKDRVMFDIRSGDHRAYLMYAFDSSVMPKTLNPSGRVLSRMLYNYEHAKTRPIIFITEGIFDAARLKTYGAGAVSIFGTALQPEQVYLLDKTKAKEIVLCLDNGVKEEILADAVKTLSMFLTRGQEISVMRIQKKDGDPDELTEEEFLYTFAARRRRVRPNFLRTKGKLDDYLKKIRNS